MSQNDRVLDQNNTDKLKQIIDLLNNLRQVGVREVDTLVAAEAEVLDRDFVRESKRFGEDSIRAKKLKDQVVGQQMLRVRLQAAAQRAEIIVPSAQPNYHIIYGRVTKKDGLGIPGLTVSIVNSESLSTINYACSDKIGYFKLKIPCKSDRRSTSKDKERIQITKAFLQISDRDKTILYSCEETFVPECNIVTYKEIEIGDEQTAACTPPPSVR